jgi:CRP-like cAMP-binding protein
MSDCSAVLALLCEDEASVGRCVMGSLRGADHFVAATFDTGRPFVVESFAARYGGVTVVKLEPGAILFTQGDPGTELFYLSHGQVQISVVSPLGKEAIITVLDPGQFCGEGCLLGDRERVATATCVAPSTVARVERTSVVRAVREDPAFAEFFLVYSLKSVVRLRDDVASQLFDDSEKRLARTLLLLAHYGAQGRDETRISNVGQEALAQMVGTTRSRVNHFMNKFRDRRYIDYDDGVIVVHDSLLRGVLHGGPSDGFTARQPSAIRLR